MDVVLHPRGFEAGYESLAEHAVHMNLGGAEVLVGSLGDLVRSKQLLRARRTWCTCRSSSGVCTSWGTNPDIPMSVEVMGVTLTWATGSIFRLTDQWIMVVGRHKW